MSLQRIIKSTILNMAQKAEDFNLPMTAITRIVRDAIPEGVRVTEGAKLALNKAASVFVLYATSSANNHSQNENRKRLIPKDVFEALKELELEVLIPPLQQALIAFRKSNETKKQAKENKRASSNNVEVEVAGDEEEVPDNEMEIQEVEEPYIIELSDSECENNESEASSD
ncbi:DNA polymerase epsilon subunit 3 [Caerostris darwini]|uniref:DNA polymerase epsilon subunit 3 n=1 Tax=Caerostris darwini TaxID=1538125 RepID=A0AAV4X2H1_9ARAC|nr:DNA polymerase epsilon subunit 3 [Caerostris darwini]